jgi:hypothetical protein
MAESLKAAGHVGLCTDAVQLVDKACEGAPDDHGAESVVKWLDALGCTA